MYNNLQVARSFAGLGCSARCVIQFNLEGESFLTLQFLIKATLNIGLGQRGLNRTLNYTNFPTKKFCSL